MSGGRPLVLVDGSNVARCRAWRGEQRDDAGDVELRRRLVDRVCSWAAQAGVEVVVAFDGAGPWRAGRTRVTPEVAVLGSGAREGDDLLEQLAADARSAGTAHWIVSSDVALCRAAGGAADRVVDADAFVRELRQAAAEAPDRGPGAGDGGTRLADRIDEAMRSRLERLRRGQG